MVKRRYQMSSSGRRWQKPLLWDAVWKSGVLECLFQESSCHAGFRRISTHQAILEFEGEKIPVFFSRKGPHIWVTVAGKTRVFRKAFREEEADFENSLCSPMPAKVLHLAVVEGEKVEEDALLLTLEAMKMEYHIKAPRAGSIKKIKAGVGEQVEAGIPLVELE
jgi:3-methylcrotonyl-CoA carboxylase alpha subunit